eukprot:2827872-Ditylum_brightwellii.AAC.2
MSKTELTKTLTMCSLDAGDAKLLPEWMKQCAEKNQTEETKDNIITKLLQSNKGFHDVDIPVTAQLQRTIRSRKWLVGAPTPTAATAATGLSPFAVGPMSEVE